MLSNGRDALVSNSVPMRFQTNCRLFDKWKESHAKGNARCVLVMMVRHAAIDEPEEDSNHDQDPTTRIKRMIYLPRSEADALGAAPRFALLSIDARWVVRCLGKL